MSSKQFSTYLYKDIPINKINEVYEMVLETETIPKDVKLTHE
jgi:hypothetical protein